MSAAPQSATGECRGGQIEHRRTTMKRHGRLVVGFVLLALAVGLVAPAPAQDKPWWPFPVEDRDPPFNMEGKKLKKDYIPIDHAAKKWNMCVSFPHMKDAYWIAVDYGVVSASRRQDAARRGRGLYEPRQAGQSDRGLCGPGRECRDHRRDLRDRTEQAHRRDHRQRDPGHRRDQRY